jgi:hypothetical protein
MACRFGPFFSHSLLLHNRPSFANSVLYMALPSQSPAFQQSFNTKEWAVDGGFHCVYPNGLAQGRHADLTEYSIYTALPGTLSIISDAFV